MEAQATQKVRDKTPHTPQHKTTQERTTQGKKNKISKQENKEWSIKKELIVWSRFPPPSFLPFTFLSSSFSQPYFPSN
jgi:hypothetical protein